MKNRKFVPVPYFRHRYDLVIDGQKMDYLSRREAAKLIRIYRRLGSSLSIVHRVELVYRYQNLCAGCYARPSEWERDSDGLFDTVQCGKCDWWACWNSRYWD